MSAPRTLTAQLKPLVQDLAKHRSVIYWGDLLLTTALFWGAFTVYVGTQVGLWGKVVAFVVAVFSLYRAATFMHEIVHLPQTVLPGFRWAWNLLCGIPILLPSFLYYSHIDHHATRLYATIRDPEYLPFGKQPLMSWLTLIVGTLLSPPLLWLRFAVLVPLAWFSPRLRRWLDMNFSSVVIHPHYRAETPRKALHKLEQQICEPLAMLYAWVVLALSLNGYLPMHVVVSFIAIATCVLLINALRTRYAHRYEHSGKSVSHAEQIEDSVTLPTVSRIGGCPSATHSKSKSRCGDLSADLSWPQRSSVGLQLVR